MENPDELYQEIMEQHPSPGTLVLILEKLRDQGRYAQIVQSSLKALELYPEDVRIRGLLADAYLQMGFLGQAEAELDKAIAVIDELVAVYKQQAMLYARQRRTKEALRFLRCYLAHHPRDKDALSLLAGSAGGQPFPQEEMDSELASPILAEIYFNQGRIQEAVETYEKVIRKNTGDLASQDRLTELKSMLEAEQTQSDSRGKVSGDQIQQTIDILETWLARIRESDV